MGDLILNHKIFITRRFEIPEEELINNIGNLKSEAFDKYSVPGLSLNILGADYIEQFNKYKTKNKGKENWTAKNSVCICNHLYDYEEVEQFVNVFFPASELHEAVVPFYSSIDKESIKLYKSLNLNNTPATDESGNVRLKADGAVFLVHAPTNLNYWHCELKLKDFKHDIVEKLKSERNKSAAQFVIDHILTATGEISSPFITAIPSNYYILN